MSTSAAAMTIVVVIYAPFIVAYNNIAVVNISCHHRHRSTGMVFRSLYSCTVGSSVPYHTVIIQPLNSNGLLLGGSSLQRDYHSKTTMVVEGDQRGRQRVQHLK